MGRRPALFWLPGHVPLQLVLPYGLSPSAARLPRNPTLLCAVRAGLLHPTQPRSS